MSETWETLDRCLGLHQQLEVIYVVDAYQATLTTADGFVEVASVQGETVEAALLNLAERLEDYAAKVVSRERAGTEE